MSGGAGVAQGVNFTFHAGGGSKWAKALRKSEVIYPRFPMVFSARSSN